MGDRKKQEHSYTIRIWQEGNLLKQHEQLSRKDAAKIWTSCLKRDDIGAELMMDGIHVRVAQAWKVLGLKQEAMRLVYQ